jgi:tetraacyldisaccharide 4'-kinase
VQRLADAARRRLEHSWWQPQPDALARTLQPLSALYAALLGRRRHAAVATRVGVPVLVVGNLIVGGAGKTPTVVALVRLLRENGWTPGVVSRGYGGARQGVHAVHDATPAHDCGDEPLLIRLRTAAPVVVSRDRVAAARALRQAWPEVDIIVSDDGLQHWALARDVQVVVFDERGVGNGRLLPAGPLREPLPDHLPHATLVLYNAAAPSTRLPGWTARRALAGVCSLADWWNGAPPQPLESLKGLRLKALAGIAQPERFFRMLEHAGLSIERCPLPDHHDFGTLPWSDSDADVVLTEKDAVKLRPERGGATRVWVAALDFHPDPAFNAALLQALPSR